MWPSRGTSGDRQSNVPGRVVLANAAFPHQASAVSTARAWRKPTWRTTRPRFTRGVLRLMAAVIHSLWENGDRNPLILPSTIPIDDGRVQSELTRYLSDNWAPIIEKDVDGPTPYRSNRLRATERLASYRPPGAWHARSTWFGADCGGSAPWS